MLEVFTSSYSKYKGNRGVQISNSIPHGVVVYKQIKFLYPEWNLVEKWNKLKRLPKDDPERVWFWSEVFVLEYWRKLDIIGERRVLDALADGDVLLCWCKDECHRHILASWLRLHDAKVTEI